MKLIFEKKYLLLLILIAMLAFVLSYIFVERNKGPTETVVDDIRVINTSNDVQQTAHIKETTYKGSSLPAELFELSFQINEDGQYLSNIELLEYLGGEDNVLPYLNTANEALMLTFAQNGLAIKEEQYLNAVKALYASSPYIKIGEKTLTPSEYALELYGMYVDNRISVEGDFETDSSLVWQSEYVYYVRGILSLTLNEDKDGIYEDTFKIPLNKKNKTLNLIVQVRFMPNNYSEILGVDILGAI